jgi:hypothetical protein
MSTFNPGTNGDLKSTNLVAAFLECAYLLQSKERPVPEIDTTEITLSNNDLVATFALTLPLESSLNTNGSLSLTTTNYIPSDTFVNGAGTLKSTTTSDAFLELTQLMLSTEATRNTANPNDIINNVSMVLDLVANNAIINATVPFTEQLVNGVPSIIATNYLAE